MKKSVWIAMEEAGTSELLSQQLESVGFQTMCFESLSSLMVSLSQQPADLIVLGESQSDSDYTTQIEAVRKESFLPLLAISGQSTLSERLTYLQVGADDVLMKPFSPMELTAKVKSLLRRVEMDRQRFSQKSESTESLVTIGNLLIDHEAQTVLCEGRMLKLTQMEFELLSFLIQNSQRAVSRRELLESIWHFEAEVQTRATDDMVKRMRKKMNEVHATVWIETVWGYGFRIMIKD